MNIFILSWIIENCAKYHCDKHVVKMILETCQLLSVSHHVLQPDIAMLYVEKDLIYKKTHMNHPCSIWVRECEENYIWLCHLGLALCNEYGFRYDKEPSDHKCYSKLMFLIHNPPPLPSNNGVITKPKMAMPDDYKSTDPVLSYRKYYLNDKARMLSWKKRDPPDWVPLELRKYHYETEIKRLIKESTKRINADNKQNIINQINKLKVILDSL